MDRSPLAAAREIAALAREHREATEASRRLAPPVVDALVEARLHRMALPRALGGLELSPVVALDVYEELAMAEASLPWIAWNNSLVCYHARFMDEATRQQVFADPAWLYAQSTRPGGRIVNAGGEVRLSGRWSLVSGCELAEWLYLSSFIEKDGRACLDDDGSPETRFVLVRRGDFEIVDTWNVGGLRGTGSHDVVVTDLLVPEAHVVSTAAAGRLDGPLGRVVINANLVAGFAAQALGVARSALDAIVVQARASETPGPVPDLRDRAEAQAGVTLHAAALAAAREHLRRCQSELWELAGAGKDANFEDIGRSMGASLYADRVAEVVVDAMYALGGTRSLYNDGVLDRAHRDIHAMMRHIVAQPLWIEDAGRATFGLEPTSPMFAF